jgi:16S rRNA (uracil1498-N3)-methyltransferase
LQLPDDAARHVQVLRMQPGDKLCLFNGLGGSHTARVVHMGKHTVDVEVLSHEPQEREALCATHIAVGMPANERMDWLVEKATELGVARITPLMTAHGVLRLNAERAHKRQLHWLGIAQAACAQSGRNTLPQIDVPQSWSAWLSTLPQDDSGSRWMLSLSATTTPLNALAQTQRVVLLSGPEGGLSREEETQAVERGFLPVRLGARVLRAETAPLAVLSHWL